MTTQTAKAAPTTPKTRRGFSFPSAFTVLFGVTVAVWLLAFVVPTGAYKISEKTGEPFPAATTVWPPACRSPTG